MNITTLNKQFGIPGQLSINEKNNDIVFIEVDSVHAKATISVYGGHVLSFKPVNQAHDLLFVSRLASFKPGKAIRGGVPVCWPWFGPDPEKQGPAHGLVRNRQWQIQKTSVLADGAIQVTLSIRDNEDTRKIWPHRFELSLVITISQLLTCKLITHNTGNSPFSLTQALHSYFNIADIHQVQLSGLEDTSYFDKTDDGQLKHQIGSVTISKETDRVYQDAKADLLIEDKSLSRNISIQSKNSRTAVVWNPWSSKAALMSDFGDEEYKNMVCVETANAGKEIVTVAPDSTFSLSSKYRIDSFSH